MTKKDTHRSGKALEVSSEYLGRRRKCTATSKRTGERCQRWARAGMRVCATHGGSTKAAKVAAAKRIAQASGYAAEMLVEFMADPATPLKDRIQIAQDLLNRAGLGGRQQVEIGMQTVSEVYARIVLDSSVAIDAEVVDEL